MKEEIKIGDKVELLHGAYKGKTGTIVGMMMLGQDYANPYYEVNMDIEVEERYKCRKTMKTPNNIIGGVTASDIKLISHYGHFKVGGKVRICSKEMAGLNGVVVTVKDLYPFALGFEFGNKYYTCLYSFVEPYVEPTEQTYAETDANDKLQEECMRFMQDCMSGEVYTQSDFLKDFDPSKHEVNPKTRCIPKIIFNSEFWDRYKADLAKEIVLKTVNCASDRRPSAVADYATAIAEAVVEGLKRK